MNFNLLKELKTYKPYNELERQNVNKVLSFLENNHNCYDRSNLDGHITAGGLICSKDGLLLLNHHKIADMWFQFGGHSDGDSNSLNVAAREILEECGLSDLTLLSNIIYDVDVQEIDFNKKKNEPKHFHYDINFLFLTNSTDCHVSSESLEIKWVTLNQAKQLVSPSDLGIQRMLDKFEKLYHNNLK